MKIYQSKLFEKQTKKIHKNEKKKLDEVINKIIAKPELGKLKKADLKEVRVYKFKVKVQQYLLAYEVINSDLYLLSFGVHENFYRNLGNFLS